MNVDWEKEYLNMLGRFIKEQEARKKAEAELDRVRWGMCGNCKRKLLIRGEGK